MASRGGAGCGSPGSSRCSGPTPYLQAVPPEPGQSIIFFPYVKLADGLVGLRHRVQADRSNQMHVFGQALNFRHSRSPSTSEHADLTAALRRRRRRLRNIIAHCNDMGQAPDWLFRRAGGDLSHPWRDDRGNRS